jgi:hypothetical protein
LVLPLQTGAQREISLDPVDDVGISKESPTDHPSWTPVKRAVVIAALATVLGSFFVTAYSLALGEAVPRHIEATLVGNPASDQSIVNAVRAVPEHTIQFTRYPSVTGARVLRGNADRLQDPPPESRRMRGRSVWGVER